MHEKFQYSIMMSAFRPYWGLLKTRRTNVRELLAAYDRMTWKLEPPARERGNMKKMSVDSMNYMDLDQWKVMYIIPIWIKNITEDGYCWWMI